MRNYTIKYFFWYLIFLIKFSSGQTILKPEINLDEFILKITPIQTEDGNYEDLYENLFTLYQNPIDLNRASLDQLRTLFFLSEIQINSILNHFEKFGPILSIYELQAIENLTLDDIKNILPFVTVSSVFNASSLKSIKNKITEHYFVLRTDKVFEQSKGFREEKYVGSPQKYYARYRLAHSKDFSLGFVTEKDPGESNFLDYFAFHVQVQNKGKIKNLIVGDYLMQFGQGLIFSAGFAPGKGSEPVFSTRRSNIGIRPYNSVLENGSLRGTAITIKNKKIEYTFMVSSNKRDATTDTKDDDREEFFSAIQTSGFHRTLTEIANRNSIVEQNIGGNILYNLGTIQVGFSSLGTFFDKPFEKRAFPYNANEFIGKTNLIIGPNASISWQNFNFFGEIARSSSGGIGYIGGLVASLNSKTEWALNFRNYQKDFHTFYGSAFSESSRTINEKGVYTGLKYTIKKGLVVSGFYDSFQFPWLKFSVDGPSSGFDYQLRIAFQPNKIFNQYIAFHYEEKEKNLPNNTSKLNSLANSSRQNLVLGTEFILNNTIKLQNKIQYNNFQIEGNKKSNGFALIQDVESKFNKISIKTRIAYFNTQNYESRIYAYENDVLYAVSFPAYYGKGMRYYAIFKTSISNHLDIWLRWSHTNVSDREFLGSGNDQLSGNQKNDLKVQLKLNF